MPAAGILLADGADEAGRMVSLAQGSDHFSLNKIPTAIAAGAVHALVVQCAQILSILHEEAPLCEVAAAHCTGHTFCSHLPLCPLKHIKPADSSMHQWLC